MSSQGSLFGSTLSERTRGRIARVLRELAAESCIHCGGTLGRPTVYNPSTLLYRCGGCGKPTYTYAPDAKALEGLLKTILKETEN